MSASTPRSRQLSNKGAGTPKRAKQVTPRAPPPHLSSSGTQLSPRAPLARLSTSNSQLAIDEEEEVENSLPPPHIEKSSRKRAASGTHGSSRDVRINFSGQHSKNNSKNNSLNSRQREGSILHHQHLNSQY
jgi:hypothetical protein